MFVMVVSTGFVEKLYRKTLPYFDVVTTFGLGRWRDLETGWKYVLDG